MVDPELLEEEMFWLHYSVYTLHEKSACIRLADASAYQTESVSTLNAACLTKA